MKNEDFNRLKEIIEREGFQVTFNFEDDRLVVTRKDPWEGVEFFTINRLRGVYKITEVSEDSELLCNYEVAYAKTICQPATEEFYVAYLKRLAFEKFGEIESGDKFNFTNTGYPFQENQKMHLNMEPKWEYNKTKDILSYHGWHIYKQGKWAERVKERVQVDFYDYGYTNNGIVTFRFKTKNAKIKGNGFHSIGNFLTKELENYLNGESGTVTSDISATTIKPTFPEDRS